MQELIGREVAKDRRRADDLLWNVVTIRALTLVALLVVMTGVVAVQGRSLESAAVILIVSLGIGSSTRRGRCTRSSTGASASSTSRHADRQPRGDRGHGHRRPPLAGAGRGDDRDPLHGRLGARSRDRVLAHVPVRAAAAGVTSEPRAGAR